MRQGYHSLSIVVLIGAIKVFFYTPENDIDHIARNDSMAFPHDMYAYTCFRPCWPSPESSNAPSFGDEESYANGTTASP